MSRSRIWTKTLKTKAKWLSAVTNEFMKYEITKEDLLSNPNKIRKYWEALKRNIPKITDSPWDKAVFERIEPERTLEQMVDKIFEYDFLLKHICLVGPEDYEVDWSDEDNRENFEEFREYLENEPLVRFKGALIKCNGCGKWTVLTSSNKKHCSPKCASRDYQRRRRAMMGKTAYNEKVKEYRKKHPEKAKQYYLNSLERKRKKEQSSKKKKNG